VAPAAQPEDWRRKYFDSIAAIEDEARQYKARQQLLYRLVSRLCAAAQGQAPAIDAELKRLRDAIRREARVEELEPLSESLAEAIRQLEEEAERTRGETLVSTQTGTATAATDSWKSGATGSQLCDVLLRLLGDLRQDPELSGAIDALNIQIGESVSREELPGVIDKVGGLLVIRMRNLEKMRKGLAALLDQMLGQLDVLNSYIKGQSEEDTRRDLSTDALNKQITTDVRAISDSVDKTDDLLQLRRQLSDRIQSISRHLQSFRDREQEHARQSRERAARMCARMEEMETRAKTLQDRLNDEQRQSMLDPLTRIPNRLAWEQRIAAELERWQKSRKPVCVVAWDIDGFKAINDRYGHRAGDKVLAVVAESLAAGIRSTDFVARYGGEEFVMLLPETALNKGAAVVDQMRMAVAETGFHFRGTPVSVTISCGITELREGDSADEVFDRADRAMYEAKNSGRNRVVSA
jgi:diguanylate cyclase